MPFVDMMSISELFVIPSRYDAFGRIGLEALLSGKFVLVSSFSGIGKILEKHCPELVFYPDVDSFTVAVMQFLSFDNSKQKALTELAKRLIEKNFSMCHVKNRYMETLSEIIQS